jgi:hypothetical protein
MAQATPNHRTWIPVEPTVASSGLVDSQVHATAGFEDAQIFSESSSGILGVMNHAIGNYDVGNSIGERKIQVICDSSRAAIPGGGEFQRNATAVEPDAVKPAFDKESEDPSRATAHVKDE